MEAVAGPALTPSGAEQGQECGGRRHTPGPLSPGWSGSCVKPVCVAAQAWSPEVCGRASPSLLSRLIPHLSDSQSGGVASQEWSRVGGHSLKLAGTPGSPGCLPPAEREETGMPRPSPWVEEPSGKGGARGGVRPSLRVNAVPLPAWGPHRTPMFLPASAHTGVLSLLQIVPAARPSLGSPLRWRQRPSTPSLSTASWPRSSVSPRKVPLESSSTELGRPLPCAWLCRELWSSRGPADEPQDSRGLLAVGCREARESVCASGGGGRGQPRPGRLSRGRELCLHHRFGHNGQTVSRSVWMDWVRRHPGGIPGRGCGPAGGPERTCGDVVMETCSPLPPLMPCGCVLQVVFSKYCNSSDIMDLFCIATGLPR